MPCAAQGFAVKEHRKTVVERDVCDAHQRPAAVRKPVGLWQSAPR
jgi:hypothetical protein